MPEETQTELRRRGLQNRRQLNPADRQRNSAIIASQFVNSRWFYRSKAIGVYLSTHDEVQTSEIILRSWRAKKDVFVPVAEKDNTLSFRKLDPETVLVRNQFGILEPVSGGVISAGKLDCVLVPLAAFDQSDNRIGMGGGFYDRSFAFLRTRKLFRKPKLVGLAYSCQRVEKIATNPWDITLCAILTE